MNLQELKKKNPAELISEAEKLGIENPSTLRKQEILFAILKKLADKKESISYHDFTYSLLKDGGVKTKIIKKYLPFINQQVNRYLQMMDFYINFHLEIWTKNWRFRWRRNKGA